LEWVDLRLGVPTAGESDLKAREQQVLKVCLAEVKRCRPFLIVLLGDRYGWVPPAERMAAAVAEEDFRVEALYTEARSGDAGAAERTKRLAELKREVEARVPDRVRHYRVGWDKQHHDVTGLEAWGRKVLEDIWSDLVVTTTAGKTQAEIIWQQAERAALEDYIADRARGFVGRDRVLARLEALAQRPQHEGAAWGICLTGAPGAGKSAIFGELFARLRQQQTFVLAHAAGASARAPSVEDMLRRWIGELGAALDTNPGLNDTADPRHH